MLKLVVNGEGTVKYREFVKIRDRGDATLLPSTIGGKQWSELSKG